MTRILSLQQLAAEDTLSVANTSDASSFMHAHFDAEIVANNEEC